MQQSAGVNALFPKLLVINSIFFRKSLPNPASGWVQAASREIRSPFYGDFPDWQLPVADWVLVTRGDISSHEVA